MIKFPLSFVNTVIEPSATEEILPTFSPTPVPDIKAPIFSPFNTFTIPSVSFVTFALSVNKAIFLSFLLLIFILPLLTSSVLTVFFFVEYRPIEETAFSFILISPLFVAFICSEYIPKDSFEFISILPLLVILIFLI